MAENDTRRATGSATGGTSGTGEPDATAESGEARGAPLPDADADSLAGGDDSAGRAIGGDSRPAGTGTAAAQSGRLTSERNPPPSAPDAGDPGGMGGVRTNQARRHDSPPGGISPVGNEGREKQES